MLLPVMNANRRAALDTLGYAEGTISHPLTKQAGYDVIVTGITGQSVFTDFTHHPFEKRAPVVVNKQGLKSTASGKYQILLRYWLASSRQHKYVDFSPYWQDTYALQAFRERDALVLIDSGRFVDFVTAINGLWASLPGKSYVGQQQRPMEWMQARYAQCGGLLVPAKEAHSVDTPLPLISPSQFGPLA